MEYLLTAVIALPLIGAALALFASERAAKVICTLFAALAFFASIPLATGYRDAVPLDVYYNESVLKKAYADYGIDSDPKRDSAHDRMVWEKRAHVLEVQARGADAATTARLKAQIEDAHARVAAAKVTFYATLGHSFDGTDSGDPAAASRSSYARFVEEVSDLDDASHGMFARTMKFAQHVSWIPSFKHPLLRRDGRPLAPARPAHDAPHAPVPRLLVAVRLRQADRGSPSAQGVLHPLPAARDGPRGRVLRARLLPLLRLLGARAAPQLLPDRHLGRREPQLCGDQVLHLHARRLGAAC